MIREPGQWSRFYRNNRVRVTTPLIPTLNYVQRIIYIIIIAVSCIGVLYRGPIEQRNHIHSDFIYFYAGGQLWNEGANPYDLPVFLERRTLISQAGNHEMEDEAPYVYPPQGSQLFALLAQTPPETAFLYFTALNLGLIALTLVLLGIILARYRPLGATEIVLLVSLLNTSFGFANLRQLGLIVFTLLLTSFLLLQSNHQILAGIALALTSFKPSFAPPYIVAELVQRRYCSALSAGMVVIVLTIGPLLLNGRPVVETLQQWSTAVSSRNTPAASNDPSPSSSDGIRMIHLEPLVYRGLNEKTPFNQNLAWGLALGLAITVYTLLWHDKQIKTPLLNFSLTSALALLIVYHRHYDVFLLFPGILVIYLHSRQQATARARRFWVGLLIGSIIMLSVPLTVISRLVLTYPWLQQLYLWRMFESLHGWVALSIMIALLTIKIRRRFTEQPIILVA